MSKLDFLDLRNVGQKSTEHENDKMAKFNLTDYWSSCSPLTYLDLWQHLCDMSDGIGGLAGWSAGGAGGRVFWPDFIPQAVGTGAVRGTKAFTFYSSSYNYPYNSSLLINWSVWQDQSSLSRLTSSGLLFTCFWSLYFYTFEICISSPSIFLFLQLWSLYFFTWKVMNVLTQHQSCQSTPPIIKAPGLGFDHFVFGGDSIVWLSSHFRGVVKNRYFTVRLTPPPCSLSWTSFGGCKKTDVLAPKHCFKPF